MVCLRNICINTLHSGDDGGGGGGGGGGDDDDDDKSLEVGCLVMVTAELNPYIHTGHAWLFLLYLDVFDRWDYMAFAFSSRCPFN